MCVALLLAMASAAGAVGRPAPEDLLARIERQGGREVLRALWDDERAFEDVLEGIETGEDAWLRVAQALQPFADGAASLSLRYALARALPGAPARILGLAGHGYAVDDLCTSPFIEPGPGVAEAYEREALAALGTVRAPALAGIAARCAERVRLPPPQP